MDKNGAISMWGETGATEVPEEITSVDGSLKSWVNKGAILEEMREHVSMRNPRSVEDWLDCAAIICREALGAIRVTKMNPLRIAHLAEARMEALRLLALEQHYPADQALPLRIVDVLEKAFGKTARDVDESTREGK